MLGKGETGAGGECVWSEQEGRGEEGEKQEVGRYIYSPTNSFPENFIMSLHGLSLRLSKFHSINKYHSLSYCFSSSSSVPIYLFDTFLCVLLFFPRGWARREAWKGI